MSETAASATATARSARLPVLKKAEAHDLVVAVAEVTVSDTALILNSDKTIWYTYNFS